MSQCPLLNSRVNRSWPTGRAIIFERVISGSLIEAEELSAAHFEGYCLHHALHLGAEYVLATMVPASSAAPVKVLSYNKYLSCGLKNAQKCCLSPLLQKDVILMSSTEMPSHNKTPTGEINRYMAAIYCTISTFKRTHITTQPTSRESQQTQVMVQHHVIHRNIDHLPGFAKLESRIRLGKRTSRIDQIT